MSYNKKNMKRPKIYSQRRLRLIKRGGENNKLGNEEDNDQMEEDLEIAFPGALARAAQAAGRRTRTWRQRLAAAAARERAEAAERARAEAAERARVEAAERARVEAERARAEAERARAEAERAAAVSKMIYVDQMQDILQSLPQPTRLQKMSGNADIINHRNDLEAVYTVMRNHFAQGPFDYDAKKDVLFDIFDNPHFDEINVNRYFDDNENSRRCKHFMKKICDFRMNKNVQTSTRCDNFVQAVNEHRYPPANEEGDEDYVEMRQIGGKSNKRKSNKRMIKRKSNKRMIKRKSNKRKTNKIRK
jgi:hypothetical protein